MIINTGQRTDIPAFYARWFINRIRAGYVLVRNPYCPSLVTKFRLDPRLVDVIGFCTKNPRPMLPYLKELAPFGQFWYVSITGYGRDLEPFVPPTDQVIEDCKTLSRQVGAQALGWRYTPVIVNERYDLAHHIATFERIAKALSGYCRLAVFGFLDIYPKLAKLHPELRDAKDEDKAKLAKAFKEIAERYGYDLRLCSKEKWLAEYGIDVAGCLRLSDYEISRGSNLILKEKMQARRSFCSCLLSNDIGAYDSCLHLCSYCYANGSEEAIRKNVARHDEHSPLLLGQLGPEDKVREAKQESFLDRQITLF